MSRVLALFCVWILAASASAETISNVTVCAISCNGDIDINTDGQNVPAGRVYFASYNRNNKTNPGTCMSQAQRLPTFEFNASELDGIAEKGCSEILHEKFFGKKVDLVIAQDKNHHPYVTEVIVR